MGIRDAENGKLKSAGRRWRSGPPPPSHACTGRNSRDIFKDLTKLEKSYKGKTEDGEEFQIEDLKIFENMAYIMAYHADNSIPPTIEECWTSLICSLSMRCCRRFWSCGART